MLVRFFILDYLMTVNLQYNGGSFSYWRLFNATGAYYVSGVSGSPVRHIVFLAALMLV